MWVVKGKFKYEYINQSIESVCGGGGGGGSITSIR